MCLHTIVQHHLKRITYLKIGRHQRRSVNQRKQNSKDPSTETQITAAKTAQASRRKHPPQMKKVLKSMDICKRQ